MSRTIELERIDDVRWRVPRQGGMRVPGIIYSDDTLIEDVRGDPCVEQVANVAHLPGIVGASLAMPDIHWGYGFPIGGVAAFEADDGEGVISPGGVGYDINCGVRLLATPLDAAAVGSRLSELMDRLFEAVPSGVGSHRSDLVLEDAQLEAVLRQGAGWVVDQGWGTAADLAHTEAGGCIEDAVPERVSRRANSAGNSSPRRLPKAASSASSC